MDATQWMESGCFSLRFSLCIGNSSEIPMSEILSYQVSGKAERDVESLVNRLADWLDKEQGKNLVFHTFSNTRWLTYGVIQEIIQKHDPLLTSRIKCYIVDSTPVAAPDLIYYRI